MRSRAVYGRAALELWYIGEEIGRGVTLIFEMNAGIRHNDYKQFKSAAVR